MAGKKGMTIPSRQVSKARKERLSENWREHISATKVMKRLQDHADGKLEKPLDPTQIKAYEVILSRLVPSLSAVEQTQSDPFGGLNREQLIEKLKLFVRDPAIARALGLPVPKPHDAEQQIAQNDVKSA